VNILGVRAAGKVNDLLTLVKLFPLLALVVAGLARFAMDPGRLVSRYTPLAPLGFGNTGAALVLIFWNGLVTFYPKPINLVTLRDGTILAGEPARSEVYRPGREILTSLDETQRIGISLMIDRSPLPRLGTNLRYISN
jgi:hypothetical protein